MMLLTPFGDNVQAAAGAEHALQGLGDSAYLLWDEDQVYTRLLSGYFKDRYTNGGGVIVAEDTYPNGSTDFSSQIEAILSLTEQPDLYYVAAMPDDVGLMVRQFRDAGLAAPIVGGDGYDAPELIGDAGAAADEVLFTTHAFMDAEAGSPAIRDFMARYEVHFGHPVENAFAALGYDAVRLLADAIGRSASLDGQALKEALETTTDFPALTGRISFRADSHVPSKGVTLVGVNDETLNWVAEITPDQVPEP